MKKVNVPNWAWAVVAVVVLCIVVVVVYFTTVTDEPGDTATAIPPISELREVREVVFLSKLTGPHAHDVDGFGSSLSGTFDHFWIASPQENAMYECVVNRTLPHRYFLNGIGTSVLSLPDAWGVSNTSTDELVLLNGGEIYPCDAGQTDVDQLILINDSEFVSASTTFETHQVRKFGTAWNLQVSFEHSARARTDVHQFLAAVTDQFLIRMQWTQPSPGSSVWAPLGSQFGAKFAPGANIFAWTFGDRVAVSEESGLFGVVTGTMTGLPGTGLPFGQYQYVSVIHRNHLTDRWLVNIPFTYIAETEPVVVATSGSVVVIGNPEAERVSVWNRSGQDVVFLTQVDEGAMPSYGSQVLLSNDDSRWW